ncbi:MAG: Uncharacterised protein [Methanobacteriota archaeon]|nr:MAG: Uncharacterised protein [Euryarchaeota archaeon]
MGDAGISPNGILYAPFEGATPGINKSETDHKSSVEPYCCIVPGKAYSNPDSKSDF